MSKRQLMVLLTGMALVFSANAFADNSLDVNNGAAIEGNFGLEVLMDGSTNSVFVADTTPDNEQIYRAFFRANKNTIDIVQGSGHNILLGRQGGGVGNIIRLSINKNNAIAGDFKLSCRILRDGGGTYFCGQFTFSPNNTRITVEYTGGTADNSGDAAVRLWKGDNLQFERTNYDSNFRIDTVRFGLPKGADATTSGSYYLDDFQSFRTLAP
ncbi:MAG: hypothetical protein AAF560_08700 [Acidobacteriota bacterium]